MHAERFWSASATPAASSGSLMRVLQEPRAHCFTETVLLRATCQMRLKRLMHSDAFGASCHELARLSTHCFHKPSADLRASGVKKTEDISPGFQDVFAEASVATRPGEAWPSVQLHKIGSCRDATQGLVGCGGGRLVDRPRTLVVPQALSYRTLCADTVGLGTLTFLVVEPESDSEDDEKLDELSSAVDGGAAGSSPPASAGQGLPLQVQPHLCQARHSKSCNARPRHQLRRLHRPSHSHGRCARNLSKKTRPTHRSPGLAHTANLCSPPLAAIQLA